MPPVLDRGHDLSLRGAVAGQLVRDHHTRGPALLFQQLAEQALGGLFVPPALDQNVEGGFKWSSQHGAGLLGGAAWFSGGTLTTLALDGTWLTLLASWVLLGIGYSAVQTPTGRLLRRSAQPPTGRRCSWRSSRSLMLAG